MWNRFKQSYLVVFSLLSVIYILLAFLPAPDTAVISQYHLTAASYRVVLLPVILLLVLIWSVACFGSYKLKSYGYLIKGSREGRAINLIADGFLILALSLPVVSIVSSLSVLVERNHTPWIKPLTIANNYLALVLMSFAFILIGRGAEKLYSMVRTKIKPLSQRVWVFTFILFSTLYSYFVIIQPAHTALGKKIYYLPDSLLLLTIVVPYLFIWYIGINAAYCINRYQSVSSGRIYRRSLNLLSIGIVIVIAGSIITRTISSMSGKLFQLNLTPLLIIIYALLLVIGAGYLLIAIGTRRMRQIEEV